jgi:hypothetical protein
MVSFLLSFVFLFAYLHASVTLLLSFLSSSCAADDLAGANSRILSLEAELKASRKAFDVATATKTTAEKSNKSALARAKKAEKALADANKERIQQDQAITECLNKMSALAGGKYHALPFFVELREFLYLLICDFSLSSPPWLFVEHTGVSSESLQLDDDPLMAAVNLLESNWISIQEIFKLVNHVLTRIFVGLWPKQKADMPADDLKKLTKVFDTPKDPILLMKSRSVKRGTEGAIALAYAHGEELFLRSTSFGATEFLREGEEVRTRHCVYCFSFSGFDDLFYTSFFESNDECVDASSQHWCYLFHAYCCCGP